MNLLFKGCKELEYLDLTNFDTSKVTDMLGIFAECNKLKEIKGINNFNTIRVINMNRMFLECNELEYLDLSNFDTSNVDDMRYMFKGCHKLKEIKGIYNFHIPFWMDEMFDECNDLENIDISKFNSFNTPLISQILNRKITKNKKN